MFCLKDTFYTLMNTRRIEIEQKYYNVFDKVILNFNRLACIFDAKLQIFTFYF